MRWISQSLAVALLTSSPAWCASVITGPNSGLPRWHHGITLLPDGRVLVVDGYSNTNAPLTNTQTAQIYDPVTNQWSTGNAPFYAGASFEMAMAGDGRIMTGDNTTFQLATPPALTWAALLPLPVRTRQNSSMTPLPSGALLLSNGDFNGTPAALNEIFNPQTNTWSDAGSLAVPRTYATSTLLADGRVLVAGGSNANNAANVELVSPGTGSVTTASSLSVARSGHCGTLLPDGTVLVTGGFTGSIPTPVTERYTASSDHWATVAPMSLGRVNHVAALMPSGKLVVMGGYDHTATYYASGETFDPVAGTWTSDIATATPRAAARAVMLPNGRLFITGGRSNTAALDSTLLIDTSQPTAASSGPLTAARGTPVLVSVPGGGVLGAGGSTGAEVFSEGTGAWAATPSPLSGSAVLGLALRDARIWVLDDSGAAAAFDADAGAWSTLAPLPSPRLLAAAVTASDGTVLVVGGVTSDGGLTPAADSFDPGTNAWTPSGPLPQARSSHTATRLLSGGILVAGGQTAAGLVAATLVFNAGAWTPSGSLSTARVGHTATLLRDGTVLVVGGATGASVTGTAELFDPTTSSWSSAGLGALTTARTGHAAVLLPNGQVLIAGGATDVAQTQVLASTELYDPVTRAFSAGPALSLARCGPSTAWLGDGRVVIAGGRSGAGTALTATDVFDEGRGAQPGWAPIIPSTHALAGQAVILNGTRFMGISSATCDNFAGGYANLPILTLRGTSGDVWPAPVSSWDAGSATLTPPNTLPVGVYTATVTVNGIPSHGAPFAYGGLVGDSCAGPDSCLSRACNNSHCVAPLGGLADAGGPPDSGSVVDAGGVDSGGNADAGTPTTNGDAGAGDASYYALRCDSSAGGPLLWAAVLALALWKSKPQARRAASRRFRAGS